MLKTARELPTSFAESKKPKVGTQQMRAARSTLHAFLAAVLTLALPAALLAIAPATAGAGPGDPLTRASSTTVINGGTIATAYDVDADAGRLAVVDTENDRVFADSQTIPAVLGAGSGNGEFDDPRGVAWGPAALYVSDSGNHRVQEFTLSLGVWTYSQQWFLGATADPRGLDVASNGFVYVADAASNVVHVIDPAAGVSTFVGTGLLAPRGVAFDGTHVVVADTGNDALKKYTLAGALDGSFSVTGLSDPADVAADADGNLFVTELLTDDVRAFSSTGASLFTFGATGSGVDQFDDPRGIAVLDGSSMYIADSENGRVELYEHTPTLSFDSATATR